MLYIYIHICFNIYSIMKTMYPLGYHQNPFVVNHALGDLMCIMYTM